MNLCVLIGIYFIGVTERPLDVTDAVNAVAITDLGYFKSVKLFFTYLLSPTAKPQFFMLKTDPMPISLSA